MTQAPLLIDHAQGVRGLEWRAVADAIEAGHALARPAITDSFLEGPSGTVLTRSAWVEGLGIAVKTATIFPGNRGIPTVNGGLALYAEATGQLEAVIDFHLVTAWKTAADSLLGALKLARPDSRRILIVGAGNVAAALRAAYEAGFPGATFEVWGRNFERAGGFARGFERTVAVRDLGAAVARADIVTCATMSATPVIEGRWLRPGQHLDLVGAFRVDMRETDDTALRRARIFVDSRDTTLAHIGELRDPLARGVISAEDVIADFHEIGSGRFRRGTAEEITLFKNGGGAHLDLMVARHILDTLRR